MARTPSCTRIPRRLGLRTTATPSPCRERHAATRPRATAASLPRPHFPIARCTHKASQLRPTLDRGAGSTTGSDLGPGRTSILLLVMRLLGFDASIPGTGRRGVGFVHAAIGRDVRGSWPPDWLGVNVLSQRPGLSQAPRGPGTESVDGADDGDDRSAALWPVDTSVHDGTELAQRYGLSQRAFVAERG
jgi:hypothetical protein